MTKPQSPTTEALREAEAEKILSNAAKNHRRYWGEEYAMARDAVLEALSRPSPIAEPQDSDAAVLRMIAGYADIPLADCHRRALERIAARLEAPIAEDALVERVVRQAFRDGCRTSSPREPSRYPCAEDDAWDRARAALQAIHEKKG